ncbi:hypothetical protein [Breoghania sp. L-A4]|uniref:hypothetical protein n=1 Tax=Breoghania sp. L-A4 TaxID=2304600 RepID=UPI000E35CD88|nr:hypothetical protein [Breoghania sp. L-A4]AXS41328.1 hypothetical protein D1F64_16480 [Breoghania sp. L-A4]
MENRDRETTVVHSANGSGAGWFIAGALVVALIAGGLFFMNGGISTDRTVDIEVTTPPAATEPAAPAAPAE